MPNYTARTDIIENPSDPRWTEIKTKYPSVWKSIVQNTYNPAKIMYAPQYSIFAPPSRTGDFVPISQADLSATNQSLQSLLQNGLSGVYFTGLNVQKSADHILPRLAQIGSKSANAFAESAQSFAITALKITQQNYQTAQDNSGGGLFSKLFGFF